MSQIALNPEIISREIINLPVAGTGRKQTMKARVDMDRREREVFALRRDGFTFQEIEDHLREKAAKTKEETGKKVAYFTTISAIHQAYDRYMLRYPERFDIDGRKEHLELAIQRAEDNYKRLNAMFRDRNLDTIEKARAMEQAGKWFDRLSKLRGLTEESVTINNFTQNNLVINDTDLIEKLDTITVASQEPTVPVFDSFKSADSVPPIPDVVDAVVVEDEGASDEFDENEPQDDSLDIIQPIGTTLHEEIKPNSSLVDVVISL